ncbi:MAG: hypothetical protein SWH78_07150 [Thermodesulfobacteriota bacterium]|nr:hypothetical protein [Thermodesulfobacteriota bacterium]
MATNFRVSPRRKKGHLELRLAGDFDGTSACELLNVLKEKCNGSEKVFIHTTGLRHIYPFGQDTFQNNVYALKGKGVNLVFTGKNAKQIELQRKKTFLTVAVP